MSAVLTQPLPTVTRSSVIRCAKCGASRPAGHLHCYACGTKLGVPPRGKWMTPLHTLASSAGLVGAAFQRLARSRRAVPATTPPPFTIVPPPTLPFSQRPLQLRSRTDRIARWYMTLSLAAAGVWYVATPHTIPTAAASPSEACAWLDSQRAQLTAEAGRLADPYRPAIAQRLADLATLVGSRTAAG
jgi:hypothetical protein